MVNMLQWCFTDCFLSPHKNIEYRHLLQKTHYRIKINYLQLIKSAAGHVCHFNRKNEKLQPELFQMLNEFRCQWSVFQDEPCCWRTPGFEVKWETSSNHLWLFTGRFQLNWPLRVSIWAENKVKTSSCNLSCSKKKTIYRIFSLWICIMPCWHSPSLQGELDFCLIEQTVICSSVFFSRCDRK